MSAKPLPPLGELGRDLGEQLIYPIKVALNEADEGDAIIFWAALLSSLGGTCCASLGQETAEKLFSEVNRIVGNSVPPSGRSVQ